MLISEPWSSRRNSRPTNRFRPSSETFLFTDLDARCCSRERRRRCPEDLQAPRGEEGPSSNYKRSYRNPNSLKGTSYRPPASDCSAWRKKTRNRTRCTETWKRQAIAQEEHEPCKHFWSKLSENAYCSWKKKETLGLKKLFDCHLNAPILTQPSKASKESWVLLPNDLTSLKRSSPNKNKRMLTESWNWLHDTDKYRRFFFKEINWLLGSRQWDGTSPICAWAVWANSRISRTCTSPKNPWPGRAGKLRLKAPCQNTRAWVSFTHSLSFQSWTQTTQCSPLANTLNIRSLATEAR